MSKTQIRGPQRVGAGVLATDTDRLVVESYSQATTEVAKRDGQAAAAAILPLRRHLWALAERLIPERLAACLRARTGTSDPTGRDGVRELRIALADWLDPPPACRWCKRPIRSSDGEQARECTASRRAARSATARPVTSFDLIDPTRTTVHRFRPWTPVSRRCRPASAVARCGTLAIFAAGVVDLHTMAAALHTPRGAASGYDVAADRDCRALLAACCAVPPRDPSDENAGAWADQTARRLHGAACAAVRPGVPAVVALALEALQRARSRNLATNGRTGIAVQLRYSTPRDGVTRADLTQGSMLGLDRGVLDYDDRQARYTTYAAAWARQGAGEVFASRDLVGAPPWVADLRRTVAERLHLHGSTACRDLLLAIEGVAESTLGNAQSGTRDRAGALVLRGPLAGLGAVFHLDGADAGKRVRTAQHERELKAADHEANGGQVADGGVGDGVGRGVHEQDTTRPRTGGQDKMTMTVSILLSAITLAESRDLVLGSRPTRYTRRRLLGEVPDVVALTAEVLAVVRGEAAGPGKRRKPAASPLRRLMRSSIGSRPKPPWRSKAAGKGARAAGAVTGVSKAAEDPERIRERLAAWVAGKLELTRTTGPGLLTALRHGAPVFVGVGSGGDDEDSQGTDGAGGEVRSAAVLPAPDDYAALHDEDEAAARWDVLLASLAALRSAGDDAVGTRGQEAAEVVRRHHGLDSIAEGPQGAGGESFVSIGESGLTCSGRVLAKETVRKIYNRAIATLRTLAEGQAADLRAEDFEDDHPVVTGPSSPTATPPRSAPVTWRPTVTLEAPAPRDPEWDRHREDLASVTW